MSKEADNGIWAVSVTPEPPDCLRWSVVLSVTDYPGPRRQRVWSREAIWAVTCSSERSIWSSRRVAFTVWGGEGLVWEGVRKVTSVTGCPMPKTLEVCTRWSRGPGSCWGLCLKCPGSIELRSQRLGCGVEAADGGAAWRCLCLPPMLESALLRSPHAFGAESKPGARGWLELHVPVLLTRPSALSWNSWCEKVWWVWNPLPYHKKFP